MTVTRVAEAAEHSLTVPDHRPLRVGTLNKIVNVVAEHVGLSSVVLSAEAQPERWRVRWRGQSWATLNSDPTIPLQVNEEVFVVERQGTCLQVISKRSLLAND